MLSAEDIAAVKVAIETCNNPDLKKEILCMSGSDYDLNKKVHCYQRKKQWYEILERKAAKILKHRGLPEKLQEKVTDVVVPIGIGMLKWAKYHEGTLGLSREYSINYLNSSFFTQQGTIDNKKTAEEFIKDENLNIKQKYKLACLYCSTNHILALYRQMTKDEKKEFYDAQSTRTIKQPVLVKFWSYYLMGDIDKLRGDKNIDLYRLEKAIESGSKAAVKYCLKETNLGKDKDAIIIDAAVETVRNKTVCTDDWIVFQDQCYDGSEESWVPSDYYLDILCFLLSEMKEDQKITFLKKDIEDIKYERQHFDDYRRSIVLDYLLNWPYQVYFMKTAELMWEFLPESDYAVLLLKICDKIESKDVVFKYGEEKNYDYRNILKEFWRQSPERYKRYVFSDQEVVYMASTEVQIKTGLELLIRLLILNNFMYADRENINLILASATDKEKENIIHSVDGKQACLNLIQRDKGVGTADRFIRWCFSSEEKIKAFKKELIFSHNACYKCANLVAQHKLELVSEFINLCLASKEEIIELKKTVAYRTSFIYNALISDYSREYIYDEQNYYIGSTFKFEGGKWVEVEVLLTWCFSSEKEISDFKKRELLQMSGAYIHFNLIRCNQWGEAETFFAWLGLSSEEIKKLKKETLFEYDPAREMFIDLMYSKEGDKRFVDYGSKQETVELFVRWFLTDKKTILEFKDEFKRQYRDITEEDEAVLKNFDFIIEQRLRDLDKI